jgi:hypothetical protein
MGAPWVEQEERHTRGKECDGAGVASHGDIGAQNTRKHDGESLGGRHIFFLTSRFPFLYTCTGNVLVCRDAKKEPKRKRKCYLYLAIQPCSTSYTILHAL